MKPSESFILTANGLSYSEAETFINLGFDLHDFTDIIYSGHDVKEAYNKLIESRLENSLNEFKRKLEEVC